MLRKFTKVTIGKNEVMALVEIDEDKIASEFAERAYNNKSKATEAHDGAIKVSIKEDMK